MPCSVFVSSSPELAPLFAFLFAFLASLGFHICIHNIYIYICIFLFAGSSSSLVWEVLGREVDITLEDYLQAASLASSRAARLGTGGRGGGGALAAFRMPVLRHSRWTTSTWRSEGKGGRRLVTYNYRCPFDRLVWLNIDGFHWFGWGVLHLPGKPIIFSQRNPNLCF